MVYVRRSVDRPIGKRLYEHMIDRLGSRWKRFSWFGLLHVTDEGTLVEAPITLTLPSLIAILEALLIEALETPQNRKQGAASQSWCTSKTLIPRSRNESCRTHFAPLSRNSVVKPDVSYLSPIGTTGSKSTDDERLLHCLADGGCWPTTVIHPQLNPPAPFPPKAPAPSPRLLRTVRCARRRREAGR